MNDRILIADLELLARTGVTAEEQAKPQRLTVSLALHPRNPFSGLDDRIENTVDYARVCTAIRSLASQHSGYLIETLAEKIARMVLADFPVLAVELELRKYILPETAFVAVSINRKAGLSS